MQMIIMGIELWRAQAHKSLVLRKERALLQTGSQFYDKQKYLQE